VEAFGFIAGSRKFTRSENLSDLPSDFLRVEFKTEPTNDKTLHGRFYREAYPAGENVQKVQFENEQIRITRLVCATGKTLELSASGEPALLVALVPSDFSVHRGKAKSGPLRLDMGQTKWLAVGQQERIENTGGAPAELLRFDFKTKPLSKDALEKNTKHEHPEK
jgi:hypothetical protein